MLRILGEDSEYSNSDTGRANLQYRMLFESIPMPLWVYDPESLRFLAVNDAAIAQYGYSRDEFLQMRITDIRPQEDFSKLESHLRLPRSQTSLPSTWQHIRKDGSLIEV